MQLARIDGTELHVSRWSFGTATLHHILSASGRRRVLDGALAAGFSHFDTSPYYGYGVAESSLGQFMQACRNKVTVATKVGLYPPHAASRHATVVWCYKSARRFIPSLPENRIDWTVSAAEASLGASLARLRTDYVDVLFLHEPNPALINADEMLRWLETELTRGRIRSWGLAGAQVASLPWVRENHRLAAVLQVKDSIDGHEADALGAAARIPQFTYGYLSALQRTSGTPIADDQLDAILRRNPAGSIIVSTTHPTRLARFAAAAERERCA